MKKTIKVGSLVTLEHDGDRNVPVFAHAGPDRGNPTSYLSEDEARVRVKRIPFTRHGERFNALWLYVESVKTPEKKGWICLNLGGWDKGLRLRIQSVTLVTASEG